MEPGGSPGSFLEPPGPFRCPGDPGLGPEAPGPPWGRSGMALVPFWHAFWAAFLLLLDFVLLVFDVDLGFNFQFPSMFDVTPQASSIY